MEEKVKEITERLLALPTDKEATKQIVQELFLALSGVIAYKIKEELDTNPDFMDQFKD